MKFDEAFGFDEKQSEDGTWIDLPDGGSLKIGMVGSHKYQQALDRHLKKYRALIRATGSLTVEQNTAVTIQVYADAILLDWKGFEAEDGTPLPCSRENRVKYLTKYPTFRSIVEAYASDKDQFQNQNFEADSKNSNNSSSGPTGLVEESLSS